MQVEEYIQQIFEKNSRTQWFVIITCPPSKLSYWMEESALVSKPYCSKVSDITWCKVAPNYTTMSSPSGPSMINDTEFQVLYFMDKDNVGKKQKKGPVANHFGFGDLDYLDSSEFPRALFRSSWYASPWQYKKTLDEEQDNAVVNLAEKPACNAEHLVSVVK
jgi:hypothetical protein